MKILGSVTLLGLFVFLLSGCRASMETAVPEIQGPALVLFYTEG